MDILQFHTQAELLFNDIEQRLDAYADKFDVDIDYETHGNVITVSFENGSKIIINTQEPLLQVWMATREQGYHFDFKEGTWVCNRSGNSFDQLFMEAVSQQAQ